MPEKVRQIVAGEQTPSWDSLATFGVATRQIEGLGRIVNLTASTTIGKHTRKVLVASVEQAVRLGADAVGVHVNISSEYEHEMLRILAEVPP